MPSSKKKRIHAFIDTNVFLSFFAFTGDDIIQLKKVREAIDADRLKLHLPQQVVDEFGRNREGKINEALEGFGKGELKPTPRLLATYAQAQQYEDAKHALLKIRSELLNAARKDAEAKSLAADELFAELCESAGIYHPSDAVYARAANRHRRGNPPGKADGPLGDKLNWEGLLVSVPKGEDLHIVTRDTDYASPFGAGRANQFLIDEWRTTKDATLYLHPEVRTFLKQMLEIEFQSLKQEKQAAVEALQNSWSFAKTHNSIAELQPMVELLDADDVTTLAKAAIDNSQIRMIVSDDDVREFYGKILPPHLQKLDPKLRDEVVELFGLGEK